MKHDSKVFFAPQLYIENGIRDIDFYKKAFGAVELRRFENPDGTVHVVELEIEGNVFHLHEENKSKKQFSPLTCSGITVIIGLFVDDVDKYMKSAVAAGATVVNPAQDYDYGYRQGEIRDPFGHLWLIEKSI